MHGFEAKQRTAHSRDASAMDTAPSRAGLNAMQAVAKPTQESGDRLAPAVQNKMERSFGFDFSKIRVHHDERAKSAGARAYAQGTHLHFAPGQYAPESKAGQAMIGHELAHVVQQSSGRVSAPAQAFGGAINDDPALEREADQMGERAASGKPAKGGAQSPAGADESLESRLTRVMGGNAARQPIQRKVEVPDETILPSFHKYLTKSGNTYSYGTVDRKPGNLSYEIFTALFNSPRVFQLQGDTSEKVEYSLMRHMEARAGVVDFARSKKYKFTGARSNFQMNKKYWWTDKGTGKYGLWEGVDPIKASKDLKENPQEYTIGCAAATKLTVEGGGDSREVEQTVSDDHDWIPGESGYIKNLAYDGRPGLEGENIIYVGGREFWGHFAAEIAIKPYQQWFETVSLWNGSAQLDPTRNWPGKGLR
jgi:hypothetical protein